MDKPCVTRNARGVLLEPNFRKFVIAANQFSTSSSRFPGLPFGILHSAALEEEGSDGEGAEDEIGHERAPCLHTQADTRSNFAQKDV